MTALFPNLDHSGIDKTTTPLILMIGRGILKLLISFLEKMERTGSSWPRRIVQDSAHLFIPFAFAAFLLLLGGALLVTWGRLSDKVLVGFCVTAGLLIGLFIICHLVLYCTWAKERTEDKQDDSDSAPQGSVLEARSVKFGSPRVCRSCLGGLSTHEPATATFGGVTARLEVSQGHASSEGQGLDKDNLQPVIEEALVEGESVGMGRAIQSPRQIQLAARTELRGGEQASSPPAGLLQRQSRDTAEYELQVGLPRPISHLSATVPPLNLGQIKVNSARSFYPFQDPASPGSRGSPGILIPTRSHQANHRGPVASSTLSAVVNNTSWEPSSPLHPDASPRAKGRSPLTISGGRSGPQGQNRNPPPRTPPTFTALTAQESTHQTTPIIRSPLRQSHLNHLIPRDAVSPSPYRSRPIGPRESRHLSRVSFGDINQRRAAMGSDFEQQRHQAIFGHDYDAQQDTMQFLRPPSSVATHMVRLREPDLARLIARGVIKVSPASRPPEWMLNYMSGSSLQDKGSGIVAIVDNGEKSTVKLRHSAESIRRNRSCKAKVECAGGCRRDDGGIGRRDFSHDSGYYTSSSGLLSDSTGGRIAGREREDGLFQFYKRALPASWSRDSPRSLGGERRTLRRRSSVPELSSRFRVGLELELDADDEGSLASSLEACLWDAMDPLGIMAVVVETGRGLDGRSVRGSIDTGEAGEVGI